MKRYLTEFIGTFFLVFSIVIGSDIWIVGATLIAMIYAGGPISKAHYNPAVTLAFGVCKSIQVKDILPYILSQLVGAALAVWLVLQIDYQVIDPSHTFAISGIRLGEWLGTFALVFVILNVAISPLSAGNQYFGIAIGLVVIGMATNLGGFSTTAFNPAVSFALQMIENGEISLFVNTLLIQFFAAFCAALVFRFVGLKK